MRVRAPFIQLILLLLAACSTEEPAGPTTGSLTITVTGLTGPAAISVTGPGSFIRSVTATTTLENLAPGTYTISAPNVTTAGARYAPDQPLSSVEVLASVTPVEKSVVYALAAHSLVVTVSGLPAGAPAQVDVSGPQSFSRAISATATIWVSLAGTYTITAGMVQVSGKAYDVTPAISTVTVSEAAAPVETAVSYALASVPFVVTVSGLPDGVPASITVTGPGNFAQTITSTTTLWPWLPGPYVITADDALVSDRTYEPLQANSTVTVTGPPSPVAATVDYSAATVAKVTVWPASATATVSLVGVQLTASTEDARGHSLRNRVIWSAANPFIATVGSTGEVRGFHEGTTIVTATADGVSASAVITVPPPVNYTLGGTWKFSLVASDSARTASCHDGGTLNIVQGAPASGFTATGTQGGSCTVRGIGFANMNFPQSFETTGTAVGRISFSLGIGFVGGCALGGTADHEPADSMAGAVSCRLDVGAGTNRHYVGTLTGTWRATRVQ